MTVRLPSQRPDCEQIQKKKHLWALIKEELEINDEMENIIASKEHETKFTIYSMLRSESESEFESESDTSSDSSTGLEALTSRTERLSITTKEKNRIKMLIKTQ
jgi:hypothetical protein